MHTMPDKFNSYQVQHEKFIVKCLLLFHDENLKQLKLNSKVDWSTYKEIKDMNMDEFMKGFNRFDSTDLKTDSETLKTNDNSSLKEDKNQLNFVIDS